MLLPFTDQYQWPQFLPSESDLGLHIETECMIAFSQANQDKMLSAGSLPLQVAESCPWIFLQQILGSFLGESQQHITHYIKKTTHVWLLVRGR